MLAGFVLRVLSMLAVWFLAVSGFVSICSFQEVMVCKRQARLEVHQGGHKRQASLKNSHGEREKKCSNLLHRSCLEAAAAAKHVANRMYVQLVPLLPLCL